MAYELLKFQAEKALRQELMLRIWTASSCLPVERAQFVFSNDNIRRLRDRKVLPGPSTAASSSASLAMSGLSKTSTSDSIAGAVLSNGLEVESRIGADHWFHGIQVQCHPYTLLVAIVDCLRAMGYVFWI